MTTVFHTRARACAAASCIALLFAMASPAQAAPIVITQTIHVDSFDLLIDGSPETVTGNWIFKITTDTTEVDQNGGTSIGNFNATVTLTQSGLGVTDMLINNAIFLWQTSDRIGWTSGGGAPQPWTRIKAAIADPNTFPSLGELTIAEFTTSLNVVAWATPFQLQNGITVGGCPFGCGGLTMSLSAELGAEVPEPATFAIFGLGLAGLGFMRRRRA